MKARDSAGGIAALAERLYSNKYLLWLTIIIVLMAGYSSLSNLPRIEDPRITNRYPSVTTIVPGASAERVESLVTQKLEDALDEIAEIKKIQSTSRNGISVLSIELQDNVGRGENEQVFSKIRDRLGDAVPELPQGAGEPIFDDKNEAIAFSILVALRWTRDDPPPLGLMYRLSEQLSDELRSIPGTEIVRYYGAPEEEIAVTVDPDVLANMGLSASDVARLIGAGDPKQPAGAVRSAQRNVFVEVDGELDSAQAVAETVLISNNGGGAVRLGDIGEISKGWREPASDIAYSNGARSIFLAVRTEESIRLDRWAVTARERIVTFNDLLGGGLQANVVFDQSVYTEQRLSSLGGNLFAGALVVMLVVFVGMGWRAALIVGSALPLSSSLAIFGLGPAGQQLHQMSIFGMLVAIGLLIDAAIVMTDEVKKHLDAGAERVIALRRAVTHLFVPLLASTLTTVLGFMPVFLLPGAMGDFVGPIAMSVVLALAASFALAMTVIPALAALFIRRCEPGQQRHWWSDGASSRRLSERYESVLHACLRRPGLTALACLVLPIAGFQLAGTLGQEFFPTADRDQVEIQVWTPRGTSVDATAELTRKIDARLAEEAGVTDVHWLVGHSFPTIYYNRVMRIRNDSAYAQAVVFTNTVADANALTLTLGAELPDEFPEARIVVAKYSQGPPVDAPVGVRIEGPDTAVLTALGQQVRQIMHSVPDVMQTYATIVGGEPKLSFVADPVAVQQIGLTLSDVAAQLQSGLEGATGGAVREGRTELPVRIRYPDDARDGTVDVAATQLVANGATVSALNVGNFELLPEAASITRENTVRANKVYAFIHRDALAVDVANAVQSALAARNFTLPPGYRMLMEGDSNEQGKAIGQLLTYLPILGLLMVATIVLSFRSVRLAAVIGVVAFLSVGLGMLGLWLGGYARGFNAVIGVAGLIGVAINGTIVVLAAIRADGASCTGDNAAIVAQTMGATRHIVSTVFTTVGGFVPLIFFSGGDFWPPLAVVIAGGVGFSITLSLFFTPAMYVLLCRLAQRTGRPLYATTEFAT
ncbi:MAG: efflux RND transporter permease subunit [Pseudomonadota bacterium]